MAHIGVFCPGVPGHLTPLSCLARELQTRGHRVTTFQPSELEPIVRRAGLDFQVIGDAAFPPGSFSAHYAKLGALQGFAAIRYLASFWIRKSEVILDEGPDAVRHAGIDLLLVDQAEMAGASVAERLSLPYITVSNALVANREPAIPPIFMGWPYSTSVFGRLRNWLAYRFQESLAKDWIELHNRKRHAWHLPLYRTFEDSTSPWAHLSQQPACFDFPRRRLPPQFHYTGPWQDRRSRPPVSFPYEKLTGQPLIYASMGTLQNRIQTVFHDIAQACAELDAQLVISLGGGSEPEQIGALPGSPLVVSFAPQLEMLSRARLTITHAGLNTALESLSYGVPMVAIPVASDQPGVAARVRWLGAGEVLPIKKLSVARLRPLVKQVFEQDRYRQRARQLQEEIRKANGIEQAVRVIERVLSGERPVIGIAASAR